MMDTVHQFQIGNIHMVCHNDAFCLNQHVQLYETYHTRMLKRVAPLDHMKSLGQCILKSYHKEPLSCCKNSFETMAMLQLTRLLLNLFFKGIIHFHKTLIHVFIQTIAYNSYS